MLPVMAIVSKGGTVEITVWRTGVSFRFDDVLWPLKLGRDEPSYLMAPSGGGEVPTSILQIAAEGAARLPKAQAFRNHCASLGQRRYTNLIIHSHNRRFVNVVGIFACRNKAFGSGNGFLAHDSNTLATKEGKVA